MKVRHQIDDSILKSSHTASHYRRRYAIKELKRTIQIGYSEDDVIYNWVVD